MIPISSRSIKISIAMFFILILVAVGSASGIQYRLTDLGDLGGNFSVATAINNNGQIVGYSQGTTGFHSFLYSNSTMIDLGTPPNTINNFAYGINDNAQIVGEVELHKNGIWSSASVYSNTNWAYLPSLVNAYDERALAINNSGQIVGYSQTSGGAMRGFISDGLTTTYLGSIPGGNGSAAIDINNNGQIVGVGYSADNRSHLFLYSDSTMSDLGIFPGDKDVTPTAINNKGQIVGYSSKQSGYGRAVLYSDSTWIDLGNLPGGKLPDGNWSAANGINDAGQIVGWTLLDIDQNDIHAFIYSDSTITDLNTLLDPSGAGWIVNNANDINNKGQIVGTGISPLGGQHAILLTPIPEPSTLILFGMGAFGLLAWIWRRR